MAIHISDLGNGHKIIENDEEYEKRTKVGCGGVFVFLLIIIGLILFTDNKHTEAEEETTAKRSVSQPSSSTNTTTPPSNNTLHNQTVYQNEVGNKTALIDVDVDHNHDLVVIDDNNYEPSQANLDGDIVQKENKETMQNNAMAEEFPASKSWQNDMAQILNLWVLYHNMKNAKSLCSLYADRVLYYQSDYSREQVRDSKRKLFKKYPTFKQEVSNVRIEQESSRIKTTFEKTVWTSTEEAPRVYPSYLYIELIDGSWKITIESDQVTDENLRKKKG